jgi:hypothetical protein
MEGLSGRGKAILSLEATSAESFPGEAIETFSLGATSDGVLRTREYNCQAALSAITTVASALRTVGVFLQYVTMAFFHPLTPGRCEKIILQTKNLLT